MLLVPDLKNYILGVENKSYFFLQHCISFFKL